MSFTDGRRTLCTDMVELVTSLNNPLEAKGGRHFYIYPIGLKAKRSPLCTSPVFFDPISLSTRMRIRRKFRSQNAGSCSRRAVVTWQAAQLSQVMTACNVIQVTSNRSQWKHRSSALSAKFSK
jgi:hypothetical protein